MLSVCELVKAWGKNLLSTIWPFPFSLFPNSVAFLSPLTLSIEHSDDLERGGREQAFLCFYSPCCWPESCISGPASSVQFHGTIIFSCTYVCVFASSKPSCAGLSRAENRISAALGPWTLRRRVKFGRYGPTKISAQLCVRSCFYFSSFVGEGEKRLLG